MRKSLNMLHTKHNKVVITTTHIYLKLTQLFAMTALMTAEPTSSAYTTRLVLQWYIYTG